MRIKLSAKPVTLSMAFLVVNLFAMPAVSAQTVSVKPTTVIANDDTTFIFAGLCPNGQTYRLMAYQTETEGKVRSMYDYKGPVGQGTVKTRATPKTMAVRVCRAMAEILDDAS